jgi:hypothetical protein
MAFIVLHRQGAAAAAVAVNVDNIVDVAPHDGGSLIVTTACYEEPDRRILVSENFSQVLDAVSQLPTSRGSQAKSA